MAKPISYLMERWKLYLPMAVVLVCLPQAASRPTFLSVTAVLIGTIAIVVALSRRPDATSQPTRPGGLTLAMELAMKRALAGKGAARPTGLVSRPDTQPAPSPQANATPPIAERKAETAEVAQMPTSAKMEAGAREIYLRVANALKDERGVHVESLLTCLGALAGYACQACVRENNTRAGAKSEAGLVVAGGADGRKYFFGDLLNKPLVESRSSVWSLVAGAIRQLGKPLPDLEGIFKHVASTVGGPQFGIPRIADGHRPRDLPHIYLRAIWPQILPIAQRFCDEPAHLPVLFGIAIHTLILRGTVDPTLAGTIAMESAVPMSKVDLV
jgi:hypothetical protein